MVEIKEEFRNRLKIAMDRANMKAIDLAKRTGISEATISQYRSGYSKPKENRLVLIANILCVAPAWLMGLDVPMELSIPTPAAGPTLSKDQEELLCKYDSLNDEGKAKVLDYTSDLVAGGRYEKVSDEQSTVSGTGA